MAAGNLSEQLRSPTEVRIGRAEGRLGPRAPWAGGQNLRPAAKRIVGLAYFFFSVCSVCLRRRRQYLLSSSFGVPGFFSRV